MATDAGNDVLFRIGAVATGLQKAANKGIKSFSKLGKAAAKYGAAATAAGAAVSVALVNNARKAIDEQSKLAKQLNTTYESMSTLKRAGDLQGISMNQISVASRTLAVRMGEAQQGLLSAEQAFEQLKIDAKELSELPLDERIQKINKALVENVEPSERAAIAADLFGSRAALAIKTLDSDVLKKAADQTKKFGLAISDVDAAKVEAANDALSGVSDVFKGFIQQITVKVAPIIEYLATAFTQAATEGTSVGEKASESFGFIVESTGFVIDAIEGVKRVFGSLGDISNVVGGKISKEFFNFSESVNETLSGMTTGSLKEFFDNNVKASQRASSDMIDVIDEAFDNLDMRAREPMPSIAFEEFVSGLDKAAEESIKKALELQKKRAQAIIDSEEEVAKDEKDRLGRKLELLQKSNLSEQALLKQKLDEDEIILKQSLANKLLDEDQFNIELLSLNQKYQEEMTAIDKKAQEDRINIENQTFQRRMSAASGFFSNIQSLSSTGSKKLFEIGKKAALAGALIDATASIVGSFKVGSQIGGPYLGAIYAGGAAIAQFANIKKIKDQQFASSGAVSAGSSSAGASLPQTQQQNNNQQLNNDSAGGIIRIQGFEEGSTFSSNQMRDFTMQFAKFMKDGARDIIFE